MTAQQTRDYVNKWLFEFRDKLTPGNLPLVAAVAEVGERIRNDSVNILRSRHHRNSEQCDMAIQSAVIVQVRKVLLGKHNEVQH